jgi:cyclopropane-fatty-acyl-phospholipid synthase
MGYGILFRMPGARQTIEELLALADVKLNGSRPFDIQVHDDRLYSRVMSQGELGFGEAYMDGWWDAEAPDELVARLMAADLRNKIRVSPALIRTIALSAVRNRQKIGRAKQNAGAHYNIGNDLYERMLDKRMIYSCAYWKEAKDLDQAQEAKLDLICQKLHLKKGMSLLDIGCGWGGFAEYAAKQYGVIVTGISPAAEQVKMASARVKGLPVTILQKDYREITGSFDRIVSIGMLEHVGPKNYRTFFNHCHNMLNDGGLMLHHAIGNLRSVNSTTPWIDKYIFPGGVLPSLAQISRAVERRLVIEDVHNFGPYYDRTLMAWQANFVRHYPEIKNHYDERFYRMWNFYLLSCAGAFRARRIQLWQIVMRKIERSDVYEAVR